MKNILLLAGGVLVSLATHAQTPAAPVADTTPAPIALAPVTPASDPNALKIKADYNPIGHVLSVRCDAPGPTRIELNDTDGRPVLTKNVISGTTAAPLNVASLPAGTYVVHCTAGTKEGMRRVSL